MSSILTVGFVCGNPCSAIYNERKRWEDDFNSVEIAQPRRYTLDTGELNNWWEKETLKKLLIRAKEGTLSEVKRNPYYQPHTQWIYDVVKEVFNETD